MKRDYKTGEHDNIVFFTGIEVERTPAYGKKTLFVTGVQKIDDIIDHYEKEQCEHIFFGANHSFNPGVNFPEDANNWDTWEDMIMYFVQRGIPCTLDLPLDHAEGLLETQMVETDLFIPQIRIPIPYIKQFGYNTMVKIDDKDFRSSNPGVWCHRLHNLMDDRKFTDWSEYGLDKPL